MMKLYKTICAALAISGSLTAAAQENMNTVTGRVMDAATGKPLVGVIVTAYGDARYTGIDSSPVHSFSIHECRRL